MRERPKGVESRVRCPYMVIEGGYEGDASSRASRQDESQLIGFLGDEAPIGWG